MNLTNASRCCLLALSVCICRAAVANDAPRAASNLTIEQRQNAVETLRAALREQPKWAKVHAAEFLLALGYPRGVTEEFERELQLHGDEPEYRVGIWRVLARSAGTPTQRNEFVDKILLAARDTAGLDQLHAIEALAKLHAPLSPDAAADVDRWTNDVTTAEGAFGHWLLASSVRDEAQRAKHRAALLSLLDSPEPLAKLRAAYALGRLGQLTQIEREALFVAGRRAATAQPASEAANLANAQVLIAAWRVAQPTGNTAAARQVRTALERLAATEPAVARAHADALADLGEVVDLPQLSLQLTSSDVDLAASAADAMLRIERRRPHKLAPLDWLVIAAYGVGMLAIGLFYARRTKNTDDYLLGSRRMSPFMVGVSLFATLLSTLTYLAIPGEMIKYGPMMLAGIAAFPLIAWIVGWSMIPFFMQFKATTAYEILETRLGYGGRALGSVIFLLLRLFWMSVIVYKTTEIVLMPLFGLPVSATPWVCAVMGVITVIYSSMGGLKAVVMTDVIQSAILLGGAILTLIVITVQLGGVGQWWPQAWDPGWAPLEWSFHPGSDRTVAAAVMAYFVWFVCTAGSDQMAVQRYLATKDVRAARRMFILSLAVNAFSTIFLGIVGFALLAYYREHPESLADGASLAAQADTLFTRFVVTGMPAGASGVVISGLLAAAMSSLSSGINSSCSIVSVDYIGRWRRGQQSERAMLRQTKVVSWIVGFFIVLLSMFVGLVQGNLFEVIQKVVNLLVAPLFVLFFMAMYVPRATGAAAYLAVFASTAAAIAVAFYEVGGLGVLWIMPVSLAIGIAVGWLASLVFRKPMNQPPMTGP